MDGREPSNKKDQSNSRSVIIAASIGAIGVIVAALIAHAAGAINIYLGGTETPHPTVTVTATGSVGVVSGSPPASPASLKQALLTAEVVGSGMSPSGSVDSFLSSVTQNTEICTAQPADGAWPIVSEELTDSPKSTVIFTERIINWGSISKAAQSITDDATALGRNGCNFSSNQTTQEFGAPTSGAAPQDCGSGDELVTPVGLSSAVPNSNYSSYSGYFVEAQCKAFTISIEDIQTSGFPQAQVDGYLSHAIGQLLSTIR